MVYIVPIERYRSRIYTLIINLIKYCKRELVIHVINRNSYYLNKGNYVHRTDGNLDIIISISAKGLENINFNLIMTGWNMLCSLKLV